MRRTTHTMSPVTLACEYLARLGYDHLLGTPHEPDDEDDQDAIVAARQLDNTRVLERLLAEEPEALTGRAGIRWIETITWPDRVLGLVTWSGQQTLIKIVRDRQLAVRWDGDTRRGSPPRRLRDLTTLDPLTLTVPMRGASGIDAMSCPDSIDVGFSIDKLDMAIEQRPALELLAIVGLETVPLVSFGARACGFVHGGSVWYFDVDLRSGGYYHRWGELREVEEQHP